MLSPPSYACLSGARPIRQTTSLLGRPHLPAHPSVLALRAIGRRRVTKAAAPAWTGNQDNALILAVRPRPVAFTGWTYLVFEDEMSDSSTSQGPPMSQSSIAESGQLSIKARGRWGRAPSPARRSDAVLSKTSLRLPPTPLRMYRAGEEHCSYKQLHLAVSLPVLQSRCVCSLSVSLYLPLFFPHAYRGSIPHDPSGMQHCSHALSPSPFAAPGFHAHCTRGLAALHSASHGGLHSACRLLAARR